MLKPSAWRRSITALQQEPSAHAPCTRTMLGWALTLCSFVSSAKGEDSLVGHPRREPLGQHWSESVAGVEDVGAERREAGLGGEAEVSEAVVAAGGDPEK